MKKIFLIVLTMMLIMPVPTLADDSNIRQIAPLNPDFLEYQQQQNIRQIMRQSTDNEFQRSYGYIPMTVNLDHIESLRETLDVKTSTTDASFNWLSPVNRVTSIKNQGSCGTCWAFGNISVMESKVWIEGFSNDQDYSEQSLVCCSDHSWVWATDHCSGGNDFMAQDTFIKKGVSLETCQPYDLATINTQGCAGCPVYQTTNFVWVAANDETEDARNSIKTAIRTYGPVTVGFSVYESLYSLVGTGSIYDVTSDTYKEGLHAVAIVGWDDSIVHPSGGIGAWLAKNSWGTSFGDGGFFWMCYGKTEATDFGSLRSIKTYDANEKLYYLDEFGWYNDTGWADISAWMANKFVTTVSGSLTYVDFYTGGVNTQYDVRIYKSSNIESLGDIQSQKIGICGDAPGYYSILLDTPVNLEEGQDFIVVAKMTTPGYNYPISYEKQVIGVSNPEIQIGRSYEKHLEDDSWIDAGKEWGENVCLRVRVAEIDTSKTVTLIATVVEPTIGISVFPYNINFGEVMIGYESLPKIIAIDNSGDLDVKLETVVSSGFYSDCLWLKSPKDGDYVKATNWMYSSLLSEDSLEVLAVVRPTAAYATASVYGTITFVAEIP